MGMTRAERRKAVQKWHLSAQKATQKLVSDEAVIQAAEAVMRRSIEEHDNDIKPTLRVDVVHASRVLTQARSTRNYGTD